MYFQSFLIKRIWIENVSELDRYLFTNIEMYLVMAITDRKDDRDTDPNMCVQGDKEMIIRNATLQLHTHWATYHNIICKQYL